MRIGRGNRSARRKPAPLPTLSTTNPTLPDLGSNLGRRNLKPATNRLSYGSSSTFSDIIIIIIIIIELHNLYSSQIIIRMIKSRKMRWTGNVERMGEKRNACRILVRMPEGKRPLGRPSRRWVDNIKMDLR
jgi:hypothetical protein